MSNKFTPEKQVELVKEALHSLENGQLTPWAFIHAVAFVVDPQPVTEADLEWARRTAERLGIGTKIN